ncbi:hypothetical protein [Devosia chinhatensis]|uniref:hypothetical protein n=1 Tax=Devosia chinhatensis TaxID=429727 RepID=UPI001364A412|nr:hypothetical protein [Devosia chinhatensis]
MPQTCIDPYAELDNRADAGELSEEFRKPVRIMQSRRSSERRTVSGIGANRNRI